MRVPVIRQSEPWASGSSVELDSTGKYFAILVCVALAPFGICLGIYTALNFPAGMLWSILIGIIVWFASQFLLLMTSWSLLLLFRLLNRNFAS